MSGPNQPADDEHVRELDVDEAFEHWSELAKRLGASDPADRWDEAQDPSEPGWEPAERTAVPSLPQVETNWNEVASTLGVSVAPDQVDWEPEEAPEAPPEPPRFEDKPDPIFTTTTKEVVVDVQSSSASPIEAVPDSWRSIWGEAEEPDAPSLPQRQEQVALDRMFGADSSRVYESEEGDRPQYFDLADDEEVDEEVVVEEEDYTSEVRFAPREQPVTPPDASGDTDEREGRKHRRGRRGQSRRRGRRSDARRSDERDVEPRTPTSPAGPYQAEADDTADEDYAFEQEAHSASDVDDDFDIEVAENDSDSGARSSRRSRNRKVASWKDAIGQIVDRNLANRDKEPSDGHRRRRGGGGGGGGRRR